MIDHIGGWNTAGVGQAYGKDYSLDRKWEWSIGYCFYFGCNDSTNF
jgi:hypothetical protein